ncbi:hypothetical protein GF394_06455 [Candidatus Fermentibacteria bacterium]|nr:hypothetical protein [Candidatus Fermentibacteria bacterium]
MKRRVIAPAPVTSPVSELKIGPFIIIILELLRPALAVNLINVFLDVLVQLAAAYVTCSKFLLEALEQLLVEEPAVTLQYDGNLFTECDESMSFKEDSTPAA